MDGSNITDVLIGGAIGVAGAMQGIALPGLLLVGLGFDVSVSLAYHLNPRWFPHSGGLSVSDILSTSIGTAIGWSLVQTLVPEKVRTNPAARAVTAAGFVLLPAAGRVPGRLRAAYRLR
jgi:hypothetical protein